MVLGVVLKLIKLRKEHNLFPKEILPSLSYTCLRMRQSMTSDWKILRNFGNKHLKLLILRSVVVAVGGF